MTRIAGVGTAPSAVHPSSLLLAHASLLKVGTTLAVHAIVCGWQNASAVSLLGARGLQVHYFPSVPVPTWARLWYRGHFAKLNVMRLAQKLQSRVIFMDNDVVAFRTVDHLRYFAAPAFTFR